MIPTLYLCPLCGRAMTGNGARTSHLRAHRRAGTPPPRVEIVSASDDPPLSPAQFAAASRENRRSDRLAELTDAIEAEHVRRYGMHPCEE